MLGRCSHVCQWLCNAFVLCTPCVASVVPVSASVAALGTCCGHGEIPGELLGSRIAWLGADPDDHCFSVHDQEYAHVMAGTSTRRRPHVLDVSWSLVSSCVCMSLVVYRADYPDVLFERAQEVSMK